MVSVNVELRGKTAGQARPSRQRLSCISPTSALEARRRSLGVLEILRQAAIPVHQGLWYERIGDQMAAARDLATPYILIMGHKEAMEGTVIVREIATNSQESSPSPSSPATSSAAASATPEAASRLSAAIL